MFFVSHIRVVVCFEIGGEFKYKNSGSFVRKEDGGDQLNDLYLNIYNIGKGDLDNCGDFRAHRTLCDSLGIA